MAAQHSYLLLDVDGVLNSTTDLENAFSDAALQTLQQVVKQHQCQIVLTSTWRLRADSLQMITDVLTELGITRAINGEDGTSKLHPMLLTPDLQGMGTRCDEIVAWLQQHIRRPNDTGAGMAAAPYFCILDDQDVLVSESESIQDVLRRNFVQTDDEVGLTAAHLPQIADALHHTPSDIHHWCRTILAHDYMVSKSIGAARDTAADAPSRDDFVK